MIPVMVFAAACYFAHDNLWTHIPVWLVGVLLAGGVCHALLTARQPITGFDGEILFDGHCGWQQASCSQRLADAPRWIISRGSRATPVGLLLHLEQQAGPQMYRWLFKGECATADYRRLARALR